jgi:uncharacterized protein
MMPEPFGPGYLHRASGEHGLSLTHGAGSNCDAPLLIALAESLADAGITVLRYNLPFRVNHRGAPRAGDAALDRDGIRAAVKSLRDVVDGHVLAGGHSYGGRQTSMAAAEDGELADALVFLSYPLHPPRRPSELRTAHFPQIRKPCLFVHGTRDPFGSPEEMAGAIKAIPGPAELYLVDRAGHDLNKPAGSVRLIAEKLIAWAGR